MWWELVGCEDVLLLNVLVIGGWLCDFGCLVNFCGRLLLLIEWVCEIVVWDKLVGLFVVGFLCLFKVC